MLQPRLRKFAMRKTMLTNANQLFYKNIFFFLFILNIFASPFGLTQALDAGFNVKPTPALQLNENEFTTVVLLNNKQTDIPGRHFNIKPELGLLTSTARTFIQEGITTEYATKVVGTTLQNGNLYAQYIKKSSRVLYEKDSTAPAAVTSWVGDAQTRLFPETHNELNYSEQPDWQNVEDRLLQDSIVYIVNTDVVEIEKNKPYEEFVKTVSLNTPDISETYSNTKATTLTIPLTVAGRNFEEKAKSLAAKKVLPIADLPTYTVKNNFFPSGLTLENETKNKLYSEAANAGLNDVLGRSPKDFYKQTFKTFNDSITAMGQNISSRILATTTYYGFSEFTTVVGDSVIIFLPSTGSHYDNNWHVTSIKGEATLGVSEIRNTQFAIQPKDEVIKFSSTESTDIFATAIFNVSQSESQSEIESEKTTEIHNEGILDIMSTSIESSEVLVATDTIPNNLLMNTIETTSETYSLPSPEEISKIFQMLASADTSSDTSSTVLEQNTESHGGATTIFFEDDIFANFIEPTVITSPANEANAAKSVTTLAESDTTETTKLLTSTTALSTSKTPTTIRETTDSTATEESTVLETTTESVDATTTVESLNEEADISTKMSIEKIIETVPGVAINASDVKEDIRVKEVASDDAKDIDCTYTSQVFLTQIPKDATQLNTVVAESLTSVQTNIVHSFDISKVTKHYCILATKANTIDHNIYTPQIEKPIETKVDEESSRSELTEQITEAVEVGKGETTVSNENDYNDEDFEGSIEEGSDEIELIYKTLYTTYTYLTTFFNDDTTTVSSHTEIITNTVTSTVSFVAETSVLNGAKIEPSVVELSGEATVMHTKFMLPADLDTFAREDEDDDIDNRYKGTVLTFGQTQQLDEAAIAKTYYTTYTYYTTIFADSESEIMSRTDVFTNVVPGIAAKDIQPTVNVNNDAENTALIVDTVSNIERPNYSTMIRNITASELVEDTTPVTFVMNVRKSSSIGEKKIIDARKNKDINFVEDQISSESNTDEIIPSATLLLQTSFTTFTYYTTMYDVDNTNVISRLETITNVVTETLEPSKIVPIDDVTLPVTYFTTFTYWTKLAKDGEITTLSREETISNVVLPTSVQTNSDAIQQTSTTDLVVNNEKLITNSVATGDAEIIPLVDHTESTEALNIIDVKPTTYYTTYTYYTTSYDLNKTITQSRLETITNIEMGKVSNTEISSSQTEFPLSMSLDIINTAPNEHEHLRLYDVKKIIDAEGISTLYFTTKIVQTVDEFGVASEISSSTSNFYIDEKRKGSASSNVLSSIKEDGSTVRVYKTGLVRLIEGTRIGNHTTTLYQSKVIGTIIDSRYAQIIESTSSFIFEKTTPFEENYQSIEPTSINNQHSEQLSTPMATPNADVVHSSIEDQTEHPPATEATDETENNAATDDSQVPTKNRIFSPVIRPFASRNRPQFAPKKKVIAPSSATIISRTDFIPTITATPALKTTGRFSSSRRTPNLSPASTYGSSQRRFGKPNKTSSGFNPASNTQSLYTASSYSSRGRLSSSRISPISRRLSSSIRPSSSGVRPGLSSSFTGSNRYRFKPSAAVEITTTAAVNINDDNENVTVEQDLNAEVTTTENPRRNQNSLLRFRRPLNRPTGFTPSPVQRSSGNSVSISPNRNPLLNRVKTTSTTTTTTTTTRPRQRSFSRPSIATNLSRPRTSNSLFPPRTLFQQEKVADTVDVKKNKENESNNDAENDSDYEDEDDEGDDDSDEENNRRRRSNTKVSIKEKISDSRKFIQSRVKRNAEGTISARDNFKTRFRRPKVLKQSDHELLSEEATEATTHSSTTQARSRASSRFGSRYQGTSTKQSTTSTPSNHRAIRPSRPTSPRTQFTLREKDTSAVSARPIKRPSSANLNKPQTSAAARRSSTKQSNSNSNRRYSSNNSYETPARSSNGRTRSNNLGNSVRSRSSAGRSRNRNDFNGDVSLPDYDGTITVTHFIPTEVTVPVVNGKITEYKNIITAKTSTEVLGPQQYTSFVGSNGESSLSLKREDSTVNYAVLFKDNVSDNILGHIEEARFNLATRIMSNGVGVIIASDKVKINENTSSTKPTNSVRVIPTNLTKPMTLAPSTLKKKMILVMPTNSKENFTLQLHANQFITKTCLTTYTYRTTYIERGNTIVETQENIISNVATEERKQPALNNTFSVGITLAQTPKLIVGVFPTTYSYYDTMSAEDKSLVYTTAYTILNTVTTPDDLKYLLQPSEEIVPVYNTNTYYSLIKFTRTVRDAYIEKVEITNRTLTQVIVTKSNPAHFKLASSIKSTATTNKNLHKQSENRQNVMQTDNSETVEQLKTKSSYFSSKQKLKNFEKSATIATYPPSGMDNQSEMESNQFIDTAPLAHLQTVVMTKLSSKVYENSNENNGGIQTVSTFDNVPEVTKNRPKPFTFYAQSSIETGNEPSYYEESDLDTEGSDMNTVIVSSPIQNAQMSVQNQPNQSVPSHAVNNILISLHNLRPVFNAMAGIIQNNIIGKQRNISTELTNNKKTTVNATVENLNKFTERPIYIPFHKLVYPNETNFIENYTTDYSNNYIGERMHRRPPNIKVDIASEDSFVHALEGVDNIGHVEPGIQFDNAYQTPLLNGGISISPGEVIRTNSDVIVGKPNGIQGPHLTDSLHYQNLPNRKNFKPPNIPLQHIPIRTIAARPQIQNQNLLKPPALPTYNQKNYNFYANKNNHNKAPKYGNLLEFTPPHRNGESYKQYPFSQTSMTVPYSSQYVEYKTNTVMHSKPKIPLTASAMPIYLANINQELKNNEILEIQHIPEIFSTKIPAGNFVVPSNPMHQKYITAIATAPAIASKKIPYLNNFRIPPAEPIELLQQVQHHPTDQQKSQNQITLQSVNVHTNQQSHDININAPPLTFRKDLEFPLSSPVNGQIQPELLHTNQPHIPHIKVPIYDEVVQINLTSQNKIGGVVELNRHIPHTFNDKNTIGSFVLVDQNQIPTPDGTQTERNSHILEPLHWSASTEIYQHNVQKLIPTNVSAVHKHPTQLKRGNYNINSANSWQKVDPQNMERERDSENEESSDQKTAFSINRLHKPHFLATTYSLSAAKPNSVAQAVSSHMPINETPAAINQISKKQISSDSIHSGAPFTKNILQKNQAEQYQRSTTTNKPIFVASGESFKFNNKPNDWQNPSATIENFNGNDKTNNWYKNATSTHRELATQPMLMAEIGKPVSDLLSPIYTIRMGNQQTGEISMIPSQNTHTSTSIPIIAETNSEVKKTKLNAKLETKYAFHSDVVIGLVPPLPKSNDLTAPSTATHTQHTIRDRKVKPTAIHKIQLLAPPVPDQSKIKYATQSPPVKLQSTFNFQSIFSNSTRSNYVKKKTSTALPAVTTVTPSKTMGNLLPTKTTKYNTSILPDRISTNSKRVELEKSQKNIYLEPSETSLPSYTDNSFKHGLDITYHTQTPATTLLAPNEKRANTQNSLKTALKRITQPMKFINTTYYTTDTITTTIIITKTEIGEMMTETYVETITKIHTSTVIDTITETQTMPDTIRGKIFIGLTPKSTSISETTTMDVLGTDYTKTTSSHLYDTQTLNYDRVSNPLHNMQQTRAKSSLGVNLMLKPSQTPGSNMTESVTANSKATTSSTINSNGNANSNLRNHTRTENNDSILIVLANNNKKNSNTIPEPFDTNMLSIDENVELDYDESINFDIPPRDEESIFHKNNNNNVLLGGVLIATQSEVENSPVPKHMGQKYATQNIKQHAQPQQSCFPSCKSLRNEMCGTADGKHSCICRIGFGRMFPDRPCKPTYTFNVKLMAERLGKSFIEYTPDLENETSSSFIYLSSVIHDALDRMIMQSDFRDVYHGVQLTSLKKDKQLHGIQVNLMLQLSDNINEKRLKEVFQKHLRLSDYSIGGTELYTSKNVIENLDIFDFNECNMNNYHDCSQYANCFNLQGTYTCSCKEGYIDLSENILYPGRICSNDTSGCEKCNFRGICLNSKTKNNKTGEEQTTMVCDCFQWYAGANCQLNLKILLISLLVLGTILLILLLLCILMLCVRRHMDKSSDFKFASINRKLIRNKSKLLSNYVPSSIGVYSISSKFNTQEKIQDSSSEHSQSSSTFMLKKSGDMSSIANEESTRRTSANHKYSDMDRLTPRQFIPGATYQTKLASFAAVKDYNKNCQEQNDRSLTVMIPRAKYQHISVLPRVQLKQQPHSIDPLDNSATTSDMHEQHLFVTPHEQKLSNFEMIQEHPNGGALVSAGYQVSAIVNTEALESKTDLENQEGVAFRIDERNSSDSHIVYQTDSQNNGFKSSLNTPEPGIEVVHSMDRWLENMQINAVSAEARSFDETTVLAATTSFRIYTDTNNANDENNTMTEREIGSTFLLPHTHLYKREKHGSELSGFDSL